MTDEYSVSPTLDRGAELTGGEASTEQLRALLGETLAGAASAISTAASAAEVAAQAAATGPKVTRTLRQMSPVHAALYQLPPSNDVRLIERLCWAWAPGALPAVYGKLIATVYVAPQGSRTEANGAPPAEWIAVDAVFADPEAAVPVSVVIDNAAPIYVPPGQTLIVQFVIDPSGPGLASFPSAQWVTIESGE